MDDFALSIFAFEIGTQCAFAQFAFQELQNNLHTPKVAIFFAHGFLNAVGNISKIFWPDRETRSKFPDSINRGRILRKLFKLSSKSSLRNRDIRNHFEHFDSRIQEWSSSSARRNFLDLIAPNM